MGCNNSKTLEEDLAAGDAAASALAGETANNTNSTTDTLDNEEDDVPTKTFGKACGRRDSIKYNKEAIEKRKKQILHGARQLPLVPATLRQVKRERALGNRGHLRLPAHVMM